MLNPIRAYAIGGALLAVVLAYTYHHYAVSRLEVKVSAAEGALQQRIAVEATTIAAQVAAARKQEAQARNKLQEDYDLLKTNAAADAVHLGAARDRLQQLARATPRSGSPNLPDAPAVADRVSNTTGTELSASDRILIDELLQVASDANAAVRERNFAAAQYEMNCRNIQNGR